ncbi:hypothetical protein BGZ90_012047 [Linnemannia elongata]|nr:hypothetical protein BGZ90_012047 [Linnemannia elongata]
MDASARTLTASLILITTAALLARSIAPSSSLSSNGKPTTANQTKTQRVKRNNKKANQTSTDEPQYVAGLVNVGNTCFMNAVLQALASLPSLKEYLQDRNDIGHDPDSITQALHETIEMLNIIYRRPTSKRLVKMVNTIKAKAAHVLTSQQQRSKESQAVICLCSDGLVTIIIYSIHIGKSEYPTTPGTATSSHSNH